MKPIVSLLALVIALSCYAATPAVPTYSITPLGLNDLEHTRDDGYTASSVLYVNSAGQATGLSNRYNGGSNYIEDSAWYFDGTNTTKIGFTGGSFVQRLNEAGQVVGYSAQHDGATSAGRTAWLYDGATTLDVGLVDAEHTSDVGYRLSQADFLNEAGHVVGKAWRYNGSGAHLGDSAWLYDGTTTIKIGLLGAEHTRSDGTKNSRAWQINEVGQAIGESDRYSGNALQGQSAWLYNGSTTLNVGLVDSEHTQASGFRYSSTWDMNNAGQAVGCSWRFNGNTSLGESAWVYNGATTKKIGLVGTEHTRSDGFRSSSPNYGINELGQVVGTSARYNGGSADLGLSTWFYNGATSVDIGLTGPEHTRSDGYKRSIAFYGVTDTGRARGISERYNGGGTMLGHSAWFFNGSATVEIGLKGAEHTRDDGYKDIQPGEMNAAGHVIGRSDSYNGGSNYLGQSAWLYDGTTSIDIGPTGPLYTRDDGFKLSSALDLSESGQVVGLSQRFNGGSTYLGQDAWLYDPVLNQTVSLNLSTRSDGYAFSSVNFLGEDGLVLGYYALFDALDNQLGYHAFSFTLAEGLHDLGSLIDGGFAVNGWKWVAGNTAESGFYGANFYLSNEGNIFSSATRTSQSNSAVPFMLTPVHLPGDFNADGTVDAADYIVWRKTGDSTEAYNLWRANFGQSFSFGSASSVSANAVVPEPATIILLLLAAAGLSFRNRRSAQKVA